MRALRLHSFGEPPTVDEVSTPQPGPGEVLVAMRYVAVNPLDVWVTRGTVAGGNQQLPMVVGTEGVGTIDGQFVLVHGGGCGVVRDGLAADFAAVPQEACTALPSQADPMQAAAIGVAGVTAYRLIHDLTQTTADDIALVLGASGGVGSLLVQLLHGIGATVIAHTSSSDKADLLQQLGATSVVVSSAPSLELSNPAPTVAFDPLGGAATARLIDLMAPFGRIGIFGTSMGPHSELDVRMLYRKAIRLLGYSGILEPHDRLQPATVAVLDLLAQGHIRVPIDTILPLEGAPDAHRRIVEHSVRGKLILDVQHRG